MVTKLVVMTDSMRNAIQQYKNDHKVRSFTFALLQLVLIGLREYGYDATMPNTWGGKRNRS